MKRAKIIVHGFVQGVFFRANILNSAREFGLSGYVKNLPDSTVEIVVEGQEDKINKLIDFCKSNPGASEVSNVEVKFEKAENTFEGFEIRH